MVNIKDDLILLRETFDSWDFSTDDISRVKAPLKEKLIEAFDSKYPILSVYKIPIWKIDKKNRNGRIYPLSLAQKIVNENKVTVSLDSHPEDDYTPKIKDIIAIGKNPFIENDILWVYCYIIDEEIDKKMSRALDLGYAFEQSSSGFGEVLNDIVNADNYFLERYFDLLVNESSYEVFLTKENEVKITEKIDTNYKDSIKIKETNNDEEIFMSTEKDKATLLLEKNFESGVSKRFKEAKTIESPSERKKELLSILSLFEDFDKDSFVSLKGSVSETLKETDKELDAIVEKVKTLDTVVKEKSESDKSLVEATSKIKELTDLLADANQKLETAYKVMDESKDSYNTLKQIYENLKAEVNSKVDAEDYSNLNEEYENLKEDFKQLYSKIKEADEEKPDEDTSEEEKDKKEKDDKEKEGQEKVAESEEEPKSDEEMSDEDLLTEEVEIEINSDEDEESEEESEEAMTEQAEDGKGENCPAKQADNDEEKIEEEDEESEEESEEDIEVEDEEKVAEKKKESVKPSLKHPTLSIENRDKIEEYYVSIRRKHGKKVVPYREGILTCSTLAEAQIFFIKKVQPVLFEDTFAPEKRNKGKEASTEKAYKSFLKEKGVRTTSNIAKLASMRGGV